MTHPLNPRPVRPAFDIHHALSRLRSEADWVALRYVSENACYRSVRNEKPDKNSVSHDQGVMVETRVNGQIGYSATSDVSDAGLLMAVHRAVELARVGSRHAVCELPDSVRPVVSGHYASPVEQGLDRVSLAALTDHLMEASRRLMVSPSIINRVAEVTLTETLQHYVSSSGSDITQTFSWITHHCGATAQGHGDTQHRSLNGPVARCAQGGLEHLNWNPLYAECERVGEEACVLLTAENCPDDELDLILAPDQMLLQIHESIGHPLELDRILGDERNYAGWSFIQPGDFGTLIYGSTLMNVTFDPTHGRQFASYGYDDCGHPASREYLIREGRLLRGLGSLESQHRLGVAGVANFRASGWNRAPIDRMANINLEPGTDSLASMVAQTERGIYMESNRSWSIDDYRNKFQFGCEYARLIEDGRLTRVVKNPNYRGITIPFWHRLKAVGHAEERQVFGTPYCGKGEPNQMIRVGHAAPPCLFGQIAVFGGGA